jgi:hypothetical protein
MTPSFERVEALSESTSEETMKKRDAKATGNDLPAICTELRGISQVAAAKLRIHQQAIAVGIEVSVDELGKFAVLLIALELD